MAAEKGRILLIPCTLGEYNMARVLPAFNAEATKEIRHFIVENDKTARRFLRAWMADFPLRECTWEVLNKHTDPADIPSFLEPAFAGKDIGLLSEAGCPAVADPGSTIVQIAHEKGLEVIPLVGPSSILLALMASGFNGQQFTFHGYLPRDRGERIRKIKSIESNVRKLGATQLFMDTPFRNMNVFEDLLAHLHNDTRLSIAIDITLDTESIQTRTVGQWKKKQPNLHKRPCIFSVGK